MNIIFEQILKHPWIGIVLGLLGLMLCWNFLKAYLKVLIWIFGLSALIAGGIYYLQPHSETAQPREVKS